VPLAVINGSRLASVFVGFALLVVARGLWRQKRSAWMIALGALILVSIFHVLKGLDIEEAVLSLSLAILLWLTRKNFFAASDPPSFRQGITAVIQASIFTLFYGILGFSLIQFRHHLPINLPQSLNLTWQAFGSLAAPPLEINTRFTRLFASSISAIAIGTYTYALFILLRPVLLRRNATGWELSRARTIVDQHACDGLAYLGLLDDKSLFFSQGGSVISFVVKRGVALVLGEPTGPHADQAACIQAFLDHCRLNDWIPAFYQVSSESCSVFEAAGFRVVEIGSNAVVDTAHFSLIGSEMKPLRAPTAKFERTAASFSVLTPPHPVKVLQDLARVSDEWLSLVQTREKHFSLGWFDIDYLETVRIATVKSADGTLLAFASLLEIPNLNEVSIDLMRKTENAPSGIMDYLFVSLIEWASMHDIARVNLGLSPLANIGTSTEDPTAQRAIHFLYKHLNRFYNFQGIHQFKHKFKPNWEPRFLALPSLANLPAIADALVRADTGDDYLLHYATRSLQSLKES